MDSNEHVLVPIFQGYPEGVVYREALMVVRTGPIIGCRSTARVSETHAIDAVTIHDAVIVVDDSPGEGARGNWEIERVTVNGVDRPSRDGRHQLGDVVAGASVAIWVRHKPPFSDDVAAIPVEFSARIMSSHAAGEIASDVNVGADFRVPRTRGNPPDGDLMVLGFGKRMAREGEIVSVAKVYAPRAIIRGAVVVADSPDDWEIVGATVNGVERPYFDEHGRCRLGDVATNDKVDVRVRYKGVHSLNAANFSACVMSSCAADALSGRPPE